MRKEVFRRFQNIIRRESGIFLTDDKMALLLNRIRKRCMQLGLPTEEDYLEVVETDMSAQEVRELIDAISTNVTSFYREGDHFEHLLRFFRECAARGRKRVRVWSAACSSGEEPYTIAMCAAEALPLNTIRFQLLASDICTKVLAKAENGVFDRKQLSQLPVSFVKKYFTEQRHSSEVKVAQPVKDLVCFRQHNLSRFPYGMSGEIDVVFCRNVMIYFDKELRERIVQEFWSLLNPGGLLFIGHAESLFGLDHSFENVDSAVYRKPVE